MTENEYYQ